MGAKQAENNILHTAAVSARCSLVGNERLKPGNVVRDFKIGNTRIKICDDMCRDKTPEDVQKILDRIARQAQRKLSAQAIHN
jgi:hypothetical protein